MKVEKIIGTILLTFAFGLFSIAQDDANECNRYKAIAGNAYKVKEYEKVVENYVKAMDECGSLEMIFYNPFIYALKQSMTNASGDKVVEDAYLDTMMVVYETAQKQHGLQNDWQLNMAYNYLKQGKPGNMMKADNAYQIGIHLEKEKVNKGYLQQYYLNLYNLWVQEQEQKNKDEYKGRIISEYFTLSDYADKGDMGSPIAEFLSSILNNVVSDCESVLPEIKNFMGKLPQDVESKKITVKNFMKLLEDKNCTNSPEYTQLVDTIIAIDPSVDAVIAKAKLQVSQGKTSAAINTFKEAIEMAETGDQKSDIEYEIAKIYFNSKNYRAAHSAGIAVSGKNAGKGFEIAARSVSALMNDCGVTTFERKANNYYAVELAERSGNSTLISQMKEKCPTSTDIFNADQAVGNSVTLSCWNKTYTIQAY